MSDRWEYAEELCAERRRRDGWIECDGCGEVFHKEDYETNNVWCECTETEEEE